MLTTRSNRLDPSLIPAEGLEPLTRLLAKPNHVTLVDGEGNQAQLPDALFAHLARIVRLMSQRKAVVLIPEEETFTTQAAANYLGMSRQHLVGLLESDEIPHHKVGTHRRIAFKDLLEYEQRRDAGRRATLGQLSQDVDAAGLYFPTTDTDTKDGEG